MLNVVVHSADIQDRDGAALVLDKRTRGLFAFIERIYADGGYQGPRVRAAAARTGIWQIEIIKRSDIAKGFVVLPKDGWSKEPWLGLAATDASRATSSVTPEPSPRSFVWP